MKPQSNGHMVKAPKRGLKPSRKIIKEELREILIPRDTYVVVTSIGKLGYQAKAHPSGRDGWCISPRSPEAAVWKLAMKLVTPEGAHLDATYAEASKVAVEWMAENRYQLTILR